MKYTNQQKKVIQLLANNDITVVQADKPSGMSAMIAMLSIERALNGERTIVDVPFEYAYRVAAHLRALVLDSEPKKNLSLCSHVSATSEVVTLGVDDVDGDIGMVFIPLITSSEDERLLTVNRLFKREGDLLITRNRVEGYSYRKQLHILDLDSEEFQSQAEVATALSGAKVIRLSADAELGGTSLSELKRKAFKNPEVKRAYDEL